MLATIANAVTLRLDAASYNNLAYDPGDASVILTIGSTGTLSVTADDGGSYPWITGGLPANYEVQVTATSGTVSTGTVGSWLALSSSRGWSVDRTTMGTKSATITIEIGLLGTSTALKTASVTMTATVDV